jgi:membrane protein DedA with SNARE-associated domain
VLLVLVLLLRLDFLTGLLGGLLRLLLRLLLRTRIGKRIVPPELREWGEGLVQRHGYRAILLGRFLVALRGPVYLAIGAARYSPLRFTLINGAVGTIEVALLVGLGYVFGRSARLAREVRWMEIAVAAAVAAILIAPPILRARLVRRRKHA